MFNVPNVQDDQTMVLVRASINTGVVTGVLALLTGSTVLYSIAFAGIIVGFIAGSICILQEKA
jgi:hypothetical protein